MKTKIINKIQLFLSVICAVAVFACSIGIFLSFGAKNKTVQATTYKTQDVAMMAKIAGWHGTDVAPDEMTNGNFELDIILGACDWASEDGQKSYSGDLKALLNGLDFFNKIKLGNKTLAEWGCTACYDNIYWLNVSSPAKFSIRIPLAMEITGKREATKAGIGHASPATILEGALIPSYAYLQGNVNATVYRAGCEFVSENTDLNYGIMSTGKTEVESVEYVQGHDGTCGYFGVSLKGDDYGCAGRSVEREEYYWSVYTSVRYDVKLLVNGEAGKAKTYGLFNLGDKGQGYYAFQMYATLEEMQTVTIPAGTTFPSFAMNNLSTANGNKVLVMYKTQTDVTFEKQPDGSWAKPLQTTDTSVESVEVPHGDANYPTDNFLMMKLSTNDYVDTLSDYTGNDVSVREFLTKHDSYSKILINGSPATAGEAFINVWSRKGIVAIRTNMLTADVTKVTILAGCKFPTYNALKDGANEAFVTTKTVSFVKNDSGEWVKEVLANVVIGEGKVAGDKSELVGVSISSDDWSFETLDSYIYNWFGNEKYVDMRKNMFINGVSLFEINTTVDDSSYVYSTFPQTNNNTQNGYEVFSNPTVLKCEGQQITVYIHKDYLHSLPVGDVTFTIGQGFQMVDGNGEKEPMTNSVSKVISVIYSVQVGNEMQKVLKGDCAVKPTVDPTKEPEENMYYTFDNWYVLGSDSPYDFSSGVYSNLEIQARFNKTVLSLRYTAVASVEHMTKTDSDNWLKIKLADSDYLSATTNYPENDGNAKTAVRNEILRLKTLENIVLKGSLKLANGSVVSQATLLELVNSHDWMDGPFINIHNQAKLGIRLPVGDGVAEIIIQKGCAFPSYKYVSGETDEDTRYIASETYRFVFDETIKEFVLQENRAFDIKMKDGASVRISNKDNKNGLRFTTQISKTEVENLKSLLSNGEYSEISFGTLIVPTDHLISARFTHEWLKGANRKYLDVASTATLDLFNDDWHSIEDGYYCFYASIVEIKSENMEREFSAVGYIKFVKDGKTTYYYADYNPANARSASWVAKSALEDRKTVKDDEYKYEIDGEYSPFSKGHNEFLQQYLTWDGSILLAQDVPSLSQKGGEFSIDIESNKQKLTGAYVELVYSTDVHLCGQFLYQNAGGTITATEDFYLQAGTTSHTQFLDIFRVNGVGYGLSSSDLYLTGIKFKNVELENCDGKVKLLGLYSYDRQVGEYNEATGTYHQEVYLTVDQYKENTKVGEITVGAHLGLGGALTYLARSGVWEGVNNSNYTDTTASLYVGDDPESVFAKEHKTSYFGGSEYGYYGHATSSKPEDGAVNLINNTDAGRQIQQAWYAGVSSGNGYTVAKCDTSTTGGEWPYNPVQAGDVKSNPSQIIDYEITSNYIYVKTRAMDWAKGETKYSTGVKGGVTTKSYMENYYRLNSDGTVYVDNKFIDWNGFTNMKNCEFQSNELPAVYAIQTLNYYVSNTNGDGSWEDELEFNSGLEHWSGTNNLMQKEDVNAKVENWFAWANGSNLDSFGMGVYIPNVFQFTSGRSKNTTELSEGTNRNAKECTLSSKNLMSNMQKIKYTYQGAYISNTSYTAPSTAYRMEEFVPIEYTYVICLGTVRDIRSTFRTIQENGIVTNAGALGKYEKVGLDAWARKDKSWTQN